MAKYQRNDAAISALLEQTSQLTLEQVDSLADQWVENNPAVSTP
jgi:hypothetical protein